MCDVNEMFGCGKHLNCKDESDSNFNESSRLAASSALMKIYIPRLKSFLGLRDNRMMPSFNYNVTSRLLTIVSMKSVVEVFLLAANVIGCDC